MEENLQFLKYYYLLTPVFAAADIFFNVNLRINIPGGHESIEYAYYLVCFFASFFVFRNALSAALFCLFECVINILLLALSVMWPLITLGGTIDSAVQSQFKFGITELLHFIIAGGVLLYCFYTNPLIFKSKRQNRML